MPIVESLAGAVLVACFGVVTNETNLENGIVGLPIVVIRVVDLIVVDVGLVFENVTVALAGVGVVIVEVRIPSDVVAGVFVDVVETRDDETETKVDEISLVILKDICLVMLAVVLCFVVVVVGVVVEVVRMVVVAVVVVVGGAEHVHDFSAPVYAKKYS